MVLDNVLSNAERHGRRAGRTRVDIKLHRDPDNWIITVDDDGPASATTIRHICSIDLRGATR